MAIRSLDREHLRASPFHPRIFGRKGAVVSEHYLAANAGADALKAGGNAVDAAVAAVLVEGVVNPHQHSLGGECPMLIQMANSRYPVVVNGNMMAPERATVQQYRNLGYSEVPDVGILAAGVPAAFGSLTTALQKFGTASFEEVSAAARELARDGFPAHPGLIRMPDFGINDLQEQFRTLWKNSADVYLPFDKVPEPGQFLQNSALADWLDSLIAVEKSTPGSRAQKIAAVRREFYRGDISAEIEKHSISNGGLLARSDLAQFETRLESPVSVQFGNVEVFKCGPWNQGPALLQCLSILKNFPLSQYVHNSVEYLHIVIESVKLAFADREQWYGDPRQVYVPIEGLLSDRYGSMRAKLVNQTHVNSEIRPGDPDRGLAVLPVEERLGGKSWGHGTVHVDAVDTQGNMVAATPSGGWLKSSEVVKSLGIPLGNRLMTFYLQPENHPNLIAPFKQPRTTISPTLVHRDGVPWIVYGSMGGDQQDQWMLQFLLNRVVFDKTIAESIEAPKFSSHHCPGFFAPHEAFTNMINIEERVGEEVTRKLQNRGHDVQVVPDWTEGYLLAIERNHETGLLEAGYDPRGAKGDVFPAAACCW